MGAQRSQSPPIEGKVKARWEEEGRVVAISGDGEGRGENW